jgi:citrate lyase gamma subunit
MISKIFICLCSSFLIVGFSSSCSSSDDEVTPATKGNISLKFSSTVSSQFGKSKGIVGYTRRGAEVKIKEFKLSIREVELLVNDDSSNVDTTDIVIFQGPFELDLLSNSSPLDQTIGDVEVPIGTYEELRFKLHKSLGTSTSSPLYNRSVYISGLIDNTPFEMWHDSGENLDVGKSTGVVVDENGINITVKFDIDQFFLNTSNPLDLGLAEDTNQNGTIEINPDDEGDENEDIADHLKDNIKEAADLLEQ